MGELARVQAKRQPNPLSTLPQALQADASRFAAFWSESLKGTAAVSARLLWWINEEGLTVEEAKEALHRLMRPEEAAKLDYSGKAMAALADAVTHVLAERRKREAEERQREADAAYDARKPATPEEVQKVRAMVGAFARGTA